MNTVKHRPIGQKVFFFDKDENKIKHGFICEIDINILSDVSNIIDYCIQEKPLKGSIGMRDRVGWNLKIIEHRVFTTMQDLFKELSDDYEMRLKVESKKDL